MAEIGRAALFGKLSKLAFRTIENGTAFCKLRGNSNVELEHWLHQILQEQDSDLHRVLRHFRIDGAILARDLTDALDRLPRAKGSAFDLSAQIEEIVERGWMYASLLYGAAHVRTGHLLVGILKTPSLRRGLLGISKQFAGVDTNGLTEAFGTWLAASPEAMEGATPVAMAQDNSASPLDAGGDGRKALERYTVDLTALARSKRVDPVFGRDDEIRQVIDILLRRRQNNPILVGEAGVGKTAVVEGLAQRIVGGDVPPTLRNVTLRTLDIGLLQAGASVKGEFERRLRQVIDEVQAAEQPVILFVDEAHTLIGAGGTAGTGDAANLLKPALARGTLRTIAATTWSEYKRHIEKDPALTRRFQPVSVAEPDDEKALRMLRSLVPAMETHHGVHVMDEALCAAVTLSRRYIADRQLPDKAVSLLDTVCARVAASQHATPPAIDRAQADIAALQAELDMVRREATIGVVDAGKETNIAARLETSRGELEALQERWRIEKTLVAGIARERAVLRGETKEQEAEADVDPDGVRASCLTELMRLQADLEGTQCGSPLVLPHVDRHAVAAVVQDWTGIPVGRMVSDDIGGLLALDTTLAQRVIGQPAALAHIARCVQTARAGLNRQGRPVGVFLLAGPSGIGKTETALALADILYGGEQNLITINMSEYQEPHSVSKLKGAPPGYVGYGEGGVLTEAVRRKPYSVVLLDEVEKAHADVHQVFYQVFDRGWMEDGEGRVIDFRQTLILLTTNAGSECLMRLCADPAALPAVDDAATSLRQPLLKVFPPALLARMTVVPYFPLQQESMRTIVRMQLQRLQERLGDEHGVVCEYDDTVVDAIIQRCGDPDSGARLVDAVLSKTVLPDIGTAMLRWRQESKVVRRIHIRVDEQDIRCDLS